MDFALLKTLATEHGGGLLDWLNETVDADAGLIDRRDIKLCLLGLGKYDAVAQALHLFITDPDFSRIRVSDPITQAILGNLKAGGVITDSDLVALNRLGVRQIPRWQSLGFTECPQQGDINGALAQ